MASILISKELLKEKVVVKNKRVLELGAGCGIPSIVTGYLGGIVTASDYPDTRLMATLEENVMSHIQANVIPHIWGQADALTGTYDVILLADTFWMQEQHDNLLSDLVN